MALWRTEPCTESPLPPHATQVRYDFLKLLLQQLNKGKKRYRTVISQNEFDFEVWVNADGNESTAAPGCPMGSEFNGRLTMRDVILARNGRVQTSNPKGANFATLLQVRPGGVATNVTRGWTRVDAKVPGAARFRFVNTHLEAFDNQASNHASTGADVGNGAIREAQAKELFEARRAGDRPAAGDPGRRPELRRQDRGQARRRARLPRAAGRRVRGAKHEPPARVLPPRRPAHDLRQAGRSATSTTRSIT